MWSEEEYWSKSKLYIKRAQESEGDESLYTFWMCLAMEFMARASISKVSPVLNADPRDVNNIYFALGFDHAGTPKTIPLHTVFLRCVDVVEGFEDRHRVFCDFLGLQRNQELHTGALPFESLKLRDWLQRYYEILDILCRHLARDLNDLLGPNEAQAARELLDTTAQELQSQVRKSIDAHKRVFDEKPLEERQRLRNDMWFRSLVADGSTELCKMADCPSCLSAGLIMGRALRTSRPYLEDDYLMEEVACLSESFSCRACGLSLPSASHLQWSGIEPRFTTIVETSLHEHQEFEFYEEYNNE